MQNKDIYCLFEKMYFFECERKEKIFARLPLSFAAIGALIGYYSFVLALPWGELRMGLQALFWTVFFFSVGCTFAAAVEFIRALLGRTDKAIPTANELETHRQRLIQHYKPYDGADEYVLQEMENVMYRHFMENSSVITLNNDWKAVRLFNCNLLLFFSAFSGLFCYFLPGMNAGA
ncbi:hypothetical protein [Pseudomonas sp. MGal98]|uniref:hypothetical protein n=1 Tax=Pseudomonas sp. MGal98 TaxID=3162460 RepID=UPI0032ED1FD6